MKKFDEYIELKKLSSYALVLNYTLSGFSIKPAILSVMHEYITTVYKNYI